MRGLESIEARCADCGAPVSTEDWSARLCLRCLAELGECALSSDQGSGGLTQRLEEAWESGEASLVPGELLGGRYRVQAHLGSGGAGEVWWVFDQKLQMDVALKSVRVEVAEQPDVLEALRREVRFARGVISHNVCRVFDVQEVKGREWISMELVTGMSLATLLEARGPLGLDEAAELAGQFLSGLQAIHEAGLVHRDFKPENVMVTPSGRVVVMDLGIAVRLPVGPGRRVCGTRAYMAPEQSRGAAVDVRADIFSAGVVLAEMVAKTRCGDLEGGEGDRKTTCPRWLRIPDPMWAGIISRAVATDREQRFSSAAELAQALAELPTAPLETSLAWPREPSCAALSPVAVVWCLLGLLLLVLATVASLGLF